MGICYNAFVGDFVKIIVCLDDNGGMLFNNRRQSRDRVVCEDVVKNLNGEKLFISPFSQILFENYKDCVSVSEDFLLNGTEIILRIFIAILIFQNILFYNKQNLKGFPMKK